MTEVPKRWQESFKIASYQVGATARVTPQTMCRLLQEVAVNHAALMNVATEEIARNDLMWVLARMRLQMEKMPSWHDEITIETWGTDRSNVASAHRDFRITDGAGHQIGQSSSIWMLLGMQNRRPAKIPDFLFPNKQPGLPDDLLNKFKLDAVDNPEFVKQFEVCLSHLDFNGHLNNVGYLEWALDTLPLPLVQDHTVCDVKIGYQAEGQYADLIVAKSTRDHSEERLAFRHQLEHKETGKVLALAKTVWAQN